MKTANKIKDKRINFKWTNAEIYKEFKSCKRTTIENTLSELPLVDVEFDQALLKQKFTQWLYGNNKTEIQLQLRIESDRVISFCTTGRSQFRIETKIKILDFFEVPYVRTLVERDDKPFESYGSLHNAKHSHKIMKKARKQLHDLMCEKNLPAELQTRIFNCMNIISRESMVYGIEMERLGNSNELLDQINK